MTDTTIPRSVINGIGRGLGWVTTIAVLALGLAALNWAMREVTIDIVPHDTTDTLSERSMMTIRTDALTGLQYLETTRGGLAPRMGPDGRQMSVDDESRLVEAGEAGAQERAGAGEAHD